MNGFVLALVIIGALALIEILIGVIKKSRGLIIIGAALLALALITIWLAVTYQNTLAPARPDFFI